MRRPEILLLPGPVPLPPEVYAAQASPIMNHRGPRAAKVYRDLVDGLRYLLRTENEVIMLTSSGTGGLESAVVNCFSPGDPVLVVSIGSFGERWKKLATAYGLDVRLLEYPWGEAAQPADLVSALEQHPDVKGVLITHSETSTGTVNDIERLAAAVREHPALLILDTVSGAGALPLEVDGWGIDVAVTGSQKALMSAPGLAFVAVSEAAWRAHAAARLPRLYFDWTLYRDAYGKDQSETPWTPAVHTMLGVQAALEMIKEEGLDHVQARHALMGRAVRAAMPAIGLELFSKSPALANVVTAVRAPAVVDGKKLIGEIRNRYSIVLAGGQGDLAGKIFRFGHVGYVERFDILAGIAALEAVLPSFGHAVEPGAGLAAAQKVFCDAEA